jgi:hypothetical protein
LPADKTHPDISASRRIVDPLFGFAGKRDSYIQPSLRGGTTWQSLKYRADLLIGDCHAIARNDAIEKVSGGREIRLILQHHMWLISIRFNLGF